MRNGTIDTTAPVEMTCICGTVHTFAPGVGTGECAGCGLGLVLTEEVSLPEDDDCDDEPADIDDCDDEPADIDDDRYTDPYTGGWEDEGYDTGCFDE